MAVLPEVKDALITFLRAEIDKRQDQRAKLREKKQLVQLEDAAQASLTASDNTILVDAGIVDRQDASQIQSNIDRLTAEIQAIQNYRDAVKAQV